MDLLLPVKFLGKSLCVAAVVTSLWGTVAAAQQVTVTERQVVQFAIDALNAGDAAAALQAADILIIRDPSDHNALFLRTQAALAAGDFVGAVSFGQRAYWNAANGNQRYAASRAIALAHARQDNLTRSQFWLRLAREDAPNEAERNAVAKDYRLLRRNNPLSVSLRFGITPSTNVNNGSSETTTDLFDLNLPFTLNGNARALSGWETSLSGSLRYMAHTNKTSATFLDFGFSSRTYTLTESAREQAEDGVDGSDFSSASLRIGATHRFLLTPDMQPTSATLSFGRTWYGGDHYANIITASAEQSWEISDADTFILSGYTQRQTTIDDDESVTTFAIQSNWLRDLDSYGSIGFNATSSWTQASDTDSIYDATKFGLTYAFPEPIFGVQLSTKISYEDREYETSRFAPRTGRTEQTTSASLQAVFTDIEFLGFQPVLNVEKVVRDASLPLFERDFVNVGFDISSSF